MAKYKLVEIKNKLVWENFILSKSPCTFLQSWNWGEVERSQGKRIFRLGYLRGKKLVGASLIVEELARRGSYLLIAAGPMIDWNDKSLVDFSLKEIGKLGKKCNVRFIRIRPEIEDSSDWKAKFRQFGFVPSPMHVHAENTWVLNITKRDDQIFSGMRKTTRYLVKKSLNSGLVMRISKDPKVASILYKLQGETAKRHRFVGFSQKRFESEIKFFGEDNQARVFVCSYEGRPLACAIIVFYGNSAYYHYSGSSSDSSKIPFSYFLQWKIIEEAKRRNLKFYNFWGIAPNDNPNHRFAGVTMFKTGFGGERIDWLHAQDLPLSKFYWFTFFFETLRRVYRRL